MITSLIWEPIWFTVLREGTRVWLGFKQLRKGPSDWLI